MYYNNFTKLSRTVNQASTVSSDKGNSFLRELVNVALIAAFVVLPIRLFIAQPFIVSGSSMEPTFANGDYLIVDQLSYRFSDPHRGDVVVFKYPKDPSKYFIKRVIGLPGETITVQDGTTYISGGHLSDPITLNESFVTFPSFDNLRITLDENEYFVMGDNRRASSDSRIWGALPESNIVGRAFARLLPAQQAELLPGQIEESEPDS